MVAANRPAAVVRGRELAPRLRVPRVTTGRALALLANSSLASPAAAGASSARRGIVTRFTAIASITAGCAPSPAEASSGSPTGP